MYSRALHVPPYMVKINVKGFRKETVCASHEKLGAQIKQFDKIVFRSTNFFDKLYQKYFGKTHFSSFVKQACFEQYPRWQWEKLSKKC